MRLRSLKGKVFVSTSGGVAFGETFSYDPSNGRLYKRVGDETIPQFCYDDLPPLPSFVQAIYRLDESYTPPDAVAELRDARHRLHVTSLAREDAAARVAAAKAFVTEMSL